MRNQGEVLLQIVGNSSETMLGAGEQQWGEGWICSACRDCSICTEGAGAVECYFLLRTLLVFSNKRCARSRLVVTKWPLRLLHALFSVGRRQCGLLPEVTTAKGLPPFHLFDQQPFNARTESSQCPQARKKGGPSSSLKAEGQDSPHKPCQLLEQRQSKFQLSLLKSQHPPGLPCANAAPPWQLRSV